MQHLAEVIDFEVLLARDEALAEAEGSSALEVRDRALGVRIEAKRPQGRLQQWVELRRRVSEGLVGERAAGALSLVGWGLGFLGCLLGAGAATALLDYDGRAPINVLAWLLATALVPFISIAILILGLWLPTSWFSKVGAAQSLLATLLEPMLLRMPDAAKWVRIVFGRAGQGKLQRWLLVGLTQVFGLGLMLSILSTLLVKVAITDLTFSWSTTLDVSDSTVANLAETIAWPWKAYLPQAVPDEEAIRLSNYQRFLDRFSETETRTAIDAAIGATWWKFCAAAVFFYGVLPRVAVLLLARWRWRVALSRWPDRSRPEVHLLEERLEAQGAFTLRNKQARQTPKPVEPVLAQPSASANGKSLYVAWGSAAAQLSKAAQAVGVEESKIMTAGADLDLSAEQVVLEKAAEADQAVQVLIPLSEPPIEDVLSFLRELRSIAPEVTVIALKEHDHSWQTTEPDPIWIRALARVQGVSAHQPQEAGGGQS